MTAFTFSVEQLRAAPIEVRRWAAAEIAHALAGVAAPQAETPRQPAPETPQLAACTPREALQIFELVGGDPIAGRIFFELARDSAIDSGMPGVHVLRIANLMRHAGIADNEVLIAGLSALDRAFRQVRSEQPENLFGLGDDGQLYIHAVTRASIRRVWEELTRARAAAERPAAAEAVAAMPHFVPPHLGPSEDIAAHDRHAAPRGDFSF